MTRSDAMWYGYECGRLAVESEALRQRLRQLRARPSEAERRTYDDLVRSWWSRFVALDDQGRAAGHTNDFHPLDPLTCGVTFPEPAPGGDLELEQMPCATAFRC